MRHSFLSIVFFFDYLQDAVSQLSRLFGFSRFRFVRNAANPGFGLCLLFRFLLEYLFVFYVIRFAQERHGKFHIRRKYRFNGAVRNSQILDIAFKPSLEIQDLATAVVIIVHGRRSYVQNNGPVFNELLNARGQVLLTAVYGPCMNVRPAFIVGKVISVCFKQVWLHRRCRHIFIVVQIMSPPAIARLLSSSAVRDRLKLVRSNIAVMYFCQSLEPLPLSVTPNSGRRHKIGAT